MVTPLRTHTGVIVLDLSILEAPSNTPLTQTLPILLNAARQGHQPNHIYHNLNQVLTRNLQPIPHEFVQGLQQILTGYTEDLEETYRTAQAEEDRLAEAIENLVLRNQGMEDLLAQTEEEDQEMEDLPDLIEEH